MGILIGMLIGFGFIFLMAAEESKNYGTALAVLGVLSIAAGITVFSIAIHDTNQPPPDCHTITIDGVAYVQADCVEIGAE